MRYTPRWIALALSLAVLLLTGCEVTAPKDPVVSPVLDKVEPSAGTPGTSIVVSGSGFGDAGSVTIGGKTATIVSWSPEAIEFDVPAGTSSAWNPLVVMVADVGEAQTDFFVGAGFYGESADLGSFLAALEPGTHALLPPGELSLDGEELVLDGVHLHGDPTGTSIDIASGGIAVMVDQGGSAGLVNLEANADYIVFRSALGGAIGAPPAEVTTVMLDGFEFAGSKFGGTAGTVDGAASDLHLLRSRVEVAGAAVLFGKSTLEVVDSQVTAAVIVGLVLPGTADIVNSTFAARVGVRVVADERIEVTGSHVTATEGNVTIRAQGPESGTPAAFGSVLIQGSVIEAHETEANGTPDGQGGVIHIAAHGDVVELIENERLNAANRIVIEVTEDVGSEGTVRLVDNLDVAAGLFAGEPGVEPNVGVYLWARGEGPNLLEVTGNHIRSNGEIDMQVSNAPGDVTITGNRLEALGAWGGSINVFLGHAGTNVVADNELVAYSGVDLRDEFVSASVKSVSVSNNTIDIVGADSPRFRLFVLATKCKFEGNVIRVEDPPSETAATNSLICRSVEATGPFQFEVDDNEITLSGPATILSVRGLGEGSVAITNNAITASRGPSSDASPGNHMLLQNNAINGGQLLVAGEGATAELIENVVTTQDLQGQILSVSHLARIAAVNNVFTVLGTPGPDATAIFMQTYQGELVIDMRDNVFTNLSRALELRFADTEAKGVIGSSVFDFPMETKPDAALIVLDDAYLTLDLRDNRWGDVTSAAELDELMEFELNGASVLELLTSPVAVLP